MSKILLFVLIVLHVALALGFASQTPYRTSGILRFQGGSPAQDIGAPDERQHVNYAARLANGKGLPVLGDPNENAYENYQAHQPPLFYVVGAAWLKIVGSDPEARASGLPIRSINAFIGAAAVLGVYFCALWSTRREYVALGALAFAALLPMNVALSGAFSNDPLLFAFFSWSAALMVRAVNDGWNWKVAIGIGVLMGLGSLTKTTAIALIPTLLVAVWASKPKTDRSALLRFAVAAFGLAILIPAPWWARNMSLYGDPLALKAFEAAFEGSPKAADFIAPLGASTYWTQWVGWWTARSSIGVFGYMDVFLPNAVYGIGLVTAMFLALVGMLGWGRKLGYETDSVNPRVFAVTATLFVVVTVLFVRFNTQYFQGQARYLFPAIAFFALAVGSGLSRLSKRPSWIPAAVLGVALLALDGYVLSVLPQEFARRVT